MLSLSYIFLNQLVMLIVASEKTKTNAIKMCVTDTLFCVCLQVHSQQHRVGHVDGHGVSTSLSDSVYENEEPLYLNREIQTPLPQCWRVNPLNETQHTVMTRTLLCPRATVRMRACLWAVLCAVMLGYIVSARD